MLTGRVEHRRTEERHGAKYSELTRKCAGKGENVRPFIGTACSGPRIEADDDSCQLSKQRKAGLMQNECAVVMIMWFTSCCSI